MNPKASSLKLQLRVLILVLLSTGPWAFSQAHSSSSPVTTVLAGLNFPVSLKAASDGRIFFNEKNTGNIRMIQKNGTLLSAPFATISPIFADGESGLLGIALDPSFDSNRYLYVYFTYRDGQSYTHGHIVRFTESGNLGTSRTDILDVFSAAPNAPPYHNGGYIKFGPDGKLYVQVGEFHQGSPAQNLSSTTGKMLRLNPDGSAPSDNPFSGSLVYASGIRNAFGFDFDSSNGRLVATEAGPSSDDEINIIVKGGNYGWPTCFGICHNPSFIDPIVDFNPVVTPTGIASVAPNVYYFGEWNTGNLERLELATNESVISMRQVYTQSGGIIAVEMGPNGKLFFTSPNGIYTYDAQSGAVSASPNILLVALMIAGAVAATTIGVMVIQYRRAKLSRDPVSPRPFLMKPTRIDRS
jgi:glucose/arabinose dehydrogenase